MPTQSLPVDLRTTDDGLKIAVLTLTQPGRPVVVIDEDLLTQLDETLNTIPSDIDGFVLASDAPRAFVAGADLKAIMAMDDDALHAYLENGARVFQRIADLPCPTVAAIHSVALGGGLELAMHCDALVGLIDPESKPFLIGLPEAGLKICPGWGGTNLLPARIDPKQAIIATATGRAMKSDAANELGIFDATVQSHDELIDACISWIRTQDTLLRNGSPFRVISTMDREALTEACNEAESELGSSEHERAVVDAIRVGLNDGWNAGLKAERDHLVRLRHTEPAQESISAFFAKSKK